MTITLLGTGTSHGIPVIGCKCKVCTLNDEKNKRLRASALIEDGENKILIDIGPDFKTQAIRYDINKIDMLLVTHSHADHIHGLDDIRIFSKNNTIPVYSDKRTLVDILIRFNYIFRHTQKGGGKPHIELKNIEHFSNQNPLVIGNLKIVPIPLKHGKQNATGWKINNFAYLTDASYISKKSISKLQDISHLVIDGLRVKPHSTHFNFEQALEIAAKTSAKYVYLTHICHDFSYDEINSILKEMQSKNPLLQNRIIESSYDAMRFSL